MAHYQVNPDGNTPKEAKIGDYITTLAGTYQIVDGASMTAEQRAAEGIGYNENSKLYSKKVSGVKTGDISYQNYNTANQWKQQADTLAKQQLQADYNTALSNAMQSFSTNLAGLKNQETETQQNYEQSVRDAQRNAYYSGQASIAGAANRGMTNSAQSQAAANSLLYGVGETMADLNSEKNSLLDKVYTNMNTLAQNYNIHLDELEKNKLAQELSMLSENQLNYLAQISNIDAYNADAYNKLRNNQIQMDWEAAENQKKMDWQSAEAEKDRAHDKVMLNLQNYYSGLGKNNNDNGTDITARNQDIAVQMLIENEHGLDQGTIDYLAKYADGIGLTRSYGDWLKLYDAEVAKLNKVQSPKTSFLDKIQNLSIYPSLEEYNNEFYKSKLNEYYTKYPEKINLQDSPANLRSPLYSF